MTSSNFWTTIQTAVTNATISHKCIHSDGHKLTTDGPHHYGHAVHTFVITSHSNYLPCSYNTCRSHSH